MLNTWYSGEFCGDVLYEGITILLDKLFNETAKIFSDTVVLLSCVFRNTRKSTVLSAYSYNVFSSAYSGYSSNVSYIYFELVLLDQLN